MLVLRLFAILCVAYIVGAIISKLKLPAILGWLITGMVFGPCLVGIVDKSLLDALWYKIFVKVFECFAGVMIGAEIVFRKLKLYGKQIIVITIIQSLGTFVVVSAIFALVFYLVNVPIYLSFIFGGIALATAPAPALSIVNQYKTEGPLTRTLIPLAALDDIVGVIVFFTVISIVSSTLGGGLIEPWKIVLMVLMPFIIGILTGVPAGIILKHIKSARIRLVLFIVFLFGNVLLGLICDKFIFQSFALNYLLIGLAFSGAVVNIFPENTTSELLKQYNPILSLSLIIVIVNLGMPLDYRYIVGAGMFTAVYIISRAAGKIGCATLGGFICKADKTVTKYLGFTLLPHSGVSLVFTGIAVSMLAPISPESAAIIQGTIAAAAIINEIIAVILAKQGFKWAGELNRNIQL